MITLDLETKSYAVCKGGAFPYCCGGQMGRKIRYRLQSRYRRYPNPLYTEMGDWREMQVYCTTLACAQFVKRALEKLAHNGGEYRILPAA